MDITDLYETIASGGTEDLSDEDLRWVRKPMYEKALREVDAPTPHRRLGALRVASWLGLDRAIAVPAKLVRDPARPVRVSAFNLAVAAGDAGRALLRDVLLGSDAQLSAASLDLLARLQDQSSLQSARRHIDHGDDTVRVAAIRVVGLVGGASVRPSLADHPDDSAETLAAKARARSWLVGETERPAPTPWWLDDDHAISTEGDLVSPAAEPVHTAGGGMNPPTEPPSEEATATAEPAASEPAEQVADAQVEPETALVPAAPSAPAEAEPTATSPSGLPDPLPDEPRALAKLYGMVDVMGRSTLLPHLEKLDAADLAAVWVSWNPGSDAAVGRGVALAAAHLGRTAFLSKARTMLRSKDPGVRGAAAEALGALGGMSTLTALRPLLADGDPTVRACTIDALASLSHRVDRVGMARSWVNRLATDEAAEVVAAIAAWPAE